jgi:hypothetical protein
VRRGDGPVTVSYGRDQSTALAPTVTGRGSFTLNNVWVDNRNHSKGRLLSPRNTQSPLYGKIKPARPVLITRDVGGVTYTLFVGHTDDQPVNPDLTAQSVSFGLVDNLADFRGQNITTGLYAGIRTGQAIGYILDAMGWDPDLRDLDPGATVIPWWWEDNTDGLTALEKVVRSEGSPALLTMGVDGAIVFRDRHHRILDAPSLTSQGTWRATGQGLVMARGFSYDESWSNIINTGTADVDVREPGPVQAVWTSDTTTIRLAEGEARLITASGSDPFYNAVVPVAGVDFTAIEGSVAVELFQTSGSSATIKWTAVGGDAVITGLQLRARPVTVTHSVQVSRFDQTSIDDYGRRSFPDDLPWCNQYDADAILQVAVATRAQPRLVVQSRFVVGNDATKVSLLGRDLSDLVTIVEPETSLNDTLHIEAIAHTMTGEHDHEVVFGLEEAPAEPSNVARADWSGVGADQGVAGAGLDDPTLVVIVDSTVAGHRVGEGVTSA